MKKQLTERQEEILTFIKQFLESNGYPPTLREIGKRFNIASTFGVKRHLEALVKKGYLNVESNASRGITVYKDSDEDVNFMSSFSGGEQDFRKIPIIGRVAAGTPLLAVENMEGSLIIDSSFMKKSQDCFALKVKGDSMINAGIFENDLVIVSPNKDVLNGDIVVALIDDEATVKTFENKNNNIRLIPANDNYNPIEISGLREFSIAGKVVGVVRWFN